MTRDQQKFMAFEGLLGWTSAVVVQARRVTAARDKFFAEIDRRGVLQPRLGPAGVRELVLRQRLAQLSFQTERHLFCNAAYQLLQHRLWVQRLGFLGLVMFAELDRFARDIDVMRDMNEHVVEYFEGKGHRPRDWVHQDEGGLVDASATFDTKIGGRLDWVELGAAAERLLAKLAPMEPFYPPRREHREDFSSRRSPAAPRARFSASERSRSRSLAPLTARSAISSRLTSTAAPTTSAGCCFARRCGARRAAPCSSCVGLAQ